jgi:7-cyano-7-deazaguanine synthase
MDIWVLMSGGIDSTACANYFLERRENVTGVFVDYGQMAREPECEAVQGISKYLQIPLRTVVFKSSRRFGAGEILGRNAFLIFAALMSESPKQGILSLGIHGGTGYYDCGNEFIGHVNHIIESYSAGRVALDCPFISVDKSFVYDYAKRIGAPLSLTYSCEQGTVPPCGICLSCRDRNALSTR